MSPGALPSRAWFSSWYVVSIGTGHIAQCPQSSPRWSPAFKTEPVLSVSSFTWSFLLLRAPRAASQITRLLLKRVRLSPLCLCTALSLHGPLLMALTLQVPASMPLPTPGASLAHGAPIVPLTPRNTSGPCLSCVSPLTCQFCEVGVFVSHPNFLLAHSRC